VRKVVIQHKKDFQYLRGVNDDWTRNPTSALSFASIYLAAEFCSRHQLKEVYIIQGDFNEASNRFDASSKNILEVPHVRSWTRDAGGPG